MSKMFAWACALAIPFAGQVQAAEFQFDLGGLGDGLLSDAALVGSFRYDVASSIFTQIDIRTSGGSFVGGTASVVVDVTEASAPVTFFSFSNASSTLVMDIEDFNIQGTGIDAGESASFAASATQGTASATDVFELDGLPIDIFGGSVTVTNRIPLASDPIPTGPTSPVTQVVQDDTASQVPGRQAAPAVVPLPASLPLVLTGLGALIWLRRRTH